MSCNKPIVAYRKVVPDEFGKRPTLFHQPSGDYEQVELACRKCHGCRRDQTLAWALRCTNEASQHQDNMFLNLTYDEQHIPEDHSLNVRDWQLFMKRLRKSIAPKKIRYYAVGEYGSPSPMRHDDIVGNKIGRPHYHAMIFGHRFPDLEQAGKGDSGESLMESEICTKLWGQGNVKIGQVTFASAAYVTGYCTKKLYGTIAEDHYRYTDPATGVVYPVKPEFSVSSNRPAIGLGFYQEFVDDYKRNGFQYTAKGKVPIPAYYLRKMEESDPQIWEDIQARKIEFALSNLEDDTELRRAVKEECAARKYNKFERGTHA